METPATYETPATFTINRWYRIQYGEFGLYPVFVGILKNISPEGTHTFGNEEGYVIAIENHDMIQFSFFEMESPVKPQR
jgi:hypothetical protein